MTFDSRASLRVTQVGHRLDEAGATSFLQQFVSRMWTANSARFETSLGDTSRSLGVQCSENLASKIWQARNDSTLRDAGLVVQRRHGAPFLTFDEVSIRFVKAPASSGLQPDWGSDFDWESNVRQEAASRNDRAYQAPRHESGHEPLFPASGLGDAGSLDDFFLVWNGLLHEAPTTAGWLAVPSLRPEHVIAAEEVWRDEPNHGDTVTPRADPVEPNSGSEPELNMRLKKHVKDTRSGS